MIHHKIILFAVTLVLPCAAEIHILLTTALSNAHAEFRKKQYLETFDIFSHYGYGKDKLYVVEALKKKGPTFLDDYSDHVFYATTNNPSFSNNGVNELATTLEALDYFKFDDEDMIIKFTGRHQLTSDYLLELVKNNPEYDAFVKVNEDGNVFTLGFAMRCKYMKEMTYGIDFNTLGHTMIPVEYSVGDYIKLKVAQGNFKVYYVDELHMKAELFGSTTLPGVAPQLNYY